jgi:hypothetical protein
MLIKLVAEFFTELPRHIDDYAQLVARYIERTQYLERQAANPVPVPPRILLPPPVIQYMNLQESIRRRLMYCDVSELVLASAAASWGFLARLGRMAQSHPWAVIMAASWPTLTFLIFQKLLRYRRRAGITPAPLPLSQSVSPPLSLPDDVRSESDDRS